MTWQLRAIRPIKRLAERAIHGTVPLRYAGSFAWASTTKSHCNVCDRKVRGFRPIPDYYLTNLRRYGWPYSTEEVETCSVHQYSCPWCRAPDRDRLIAMYFQSFWDNRDTSSPFQMLDFAPSRPLTSFFRKRLTQTATRNVYRTADLYAPDVEDKIDITNMSSYPDHSWDFFICSHILEHVDDDIKALSELHRVLRPGGRGLLLAPIILSLKNTDEDPSLTDVNERWRRFGQDDHVRIYSKQGFIDRIVNAGFRIEQYTPAQHSHNAYATFGMTSTSTLYIAIRDI